MKKIALVTVAVIALAIGAYFLFFREKAVEWQEIPVEKSSFLVTIPAGGKVEPENKISITASINGRIDRILKNEGDEVRRGEPIAWMSSTDRAALLDSAQTQGSTSEWADVYKPTPVLSPAKGVIIAKSIVPGQTVTQQTVLFELSDRLIILADVDETDLGKIRMDQEAQVTVDSFPGMVVKSKVARIAHQSKIKNSINTYEVLLVPDNLPEEFRSGLTASVQFVFEKKEDAVQLPTWVAEGRENFETELFVKAPNGPEKRQVKFGLSNGQKIEVLSGLQAGDVVLVQSKSVLSENVPGTVFGVGGGRRKK
jgi:macrolide-specific efflux system membrane fusion protein